MDYNVYPFLNEVMDSPLVKNFVFRSTEIIKGALYLFLGFQGFISEEPLKGPEGHLRCVMCRVVVKEAWPESRRRPSAKLAQ